jgi:hypothetical protein
MFFAKNLMLYNSGILNHCIRQPPNPIPLGSHDTNSTAETQT